MNTPLTEFTARRAKNGWVINPNPALYDGNTCEEPVFVSFAEMGDWLRVQVERDVAGKAD